MIRHQKHKSIFLLKKKVRPPPPPSCYQTLGLRHFLSLYYINIYVFETRKAWNGLFEDEQKTLVLKEKNLGKVDFN